MAKNLDAETASNIVECFGSGDDRFARDEIDIERAFKLLASLRQQQVTWTDLRHVLRRQMRAETSAEMRVEITDRAKRLFKPWLHH